MHKLYALRGLLKSSCLLGWICLEMYLVRFCLSLALGCFFMVLSAIFKIAKQAKEENELTI